MSDPVGEFALRHTGTTYTKTAEGVVSSSNWEGAAGDYGAVFGTLAVPLAMTSASDGPCTWAAQAFPVDSPFLVGVGEGTWQQVEGRHAWKVSMVVEVSNGDKLRSEGEIDLATRTYTGKMYSANGS